MRNQEWGTARPIVPDHFRFELETINEEVRLACEELDAARHRHGEAVLARIAMATDATDQELQAAKELINSASKRYVSAIEKRIAVSDNINKFTRGQEHQPMAG